MLTPDTCKAVVIHGPRQASIRDRSVPRMRPQEVMVKLAYVGVCVTDLEIFDGTLGYYRTNLASYPIVPGHEVSGMIVATGADVNNLSPGDAVVVECIQSCGTCRACVGGQPINCAERSELGVAGRDGGYSELFVVPARFVHRIPKTVRLDEACLCEPLAVALKGLERLAYVWGREETKNCAVVGAGPLGRLCSLVLVHRGHRVKIFDRDPRRLAVGNGIATSAALEDLSTFDAIVEATGDQAALDIVLTTSRTGVQILLLGLPYGQSSFSFENLVAYDKTVVGSVGSSSRHFELALQLLPELNVVDFIGKVLPLEAFAEAWKLARERTHLKVLLTSAA